MAESVAEVQMRSHSPILPEGVVWWRQQPVRRSVRGMCRSACAAPCRGAMDVHAEEFIFHRLHGAARVLRNMLEERRPKPERRMWRLRNEAGRCPSGLVAMACEEGWQEVAAARRGRWQAVREARRAVCLEAGRKRGGRRSVKAAWQPL